MKSCRVSGQCCCQMVSSAWVIVSNFLSFGCQMCSMGWLFLQPLQGREEAEEHCKVLSLGEEVCLGKAVTCPVSSEWWLEEVS